MKKEHATKCASHTMKYHGDMRNRFPDVKNECDCDGYHSFNELYDHRIMLYIALCRVIKDEHYINEDEKTIEKIVWRSKYHSDGELCFGTGTQFVLGVFRDKGCQITYHIPIERWNETDFAETLEKAPEWDKHTSDDVIERLKVL